MRLRDGTTPQQALDALNEAMNLLTNAANSANYSPQEAYLEAVPDAEVRLGNGFERTWIIDTLYTRRYWYLVDGAPGRHANISASQERQAQLERLERVKSEVNRLMVFASMPGTILVVDTNVLMHAYSLDKIMWSQWLKLAAKETLRILVALAVVDELDRKKFEGGASSQKKAQDAIRDLRRLRGDALPDTPAVFAANDRTVLTLEIPRDDVGRTRPGSTDDEVRDFSVFVQQITGKPVKVVMWDMGAELRCKRAGLDILWLDDKERKQ